LVLGDEGISVRWAIEYGLHFTFNLARSGKSMV